MLMYFKSASRRPLWLLAIMAAVVVGIALAAAVREKQSTQARRVLADVGLIEHAARGYGMEGRNLPRKFDDEAAWKTYCYHERATLIEEARAASQ